MRFWPRKTWKKAVLVVLIALVAVAAFFEWSVYREVSASTETLNAGGSKSALVIYHPGLTSFAHDIAENFSRGLASSGWQVDIATASQQAPTNISKYQLLVLCWPIYDFNPAPTITSQIHRLGDLQGTKTIVVAVAGGLDPLNAVGNMDNIVHSANGTVIDTLRAFRGSHNLDLQEKASQIIP